MPGSIRSKIQLVAVLFLLGGAAANLLRFHERLAQIGPRPADPVVSWENRLAGALHILGGMGYTHGDIGYVSGATLAGNPRTVQDDVHWNYTRYAMIPLNVLQDSLDAPFVLLDHHLDPKAAPIPAGFTVAHDFKNGLLLLRRLEPQ